MTHLSLVKLESSPDDLDKFPHSDVIWDEELCLVEDWELFLPREPLYDAGDLAGVLRPDLLHVLDSQSCQEKSKSLIQRIKIVGKNPNNVYLLTAH